MKIEDIAYLLTDYVTCADMEGRLFRTVEFAKNFAVWSKEWRVLSAKPLYMLSPDALLRQIRKAITFLIKRHRVKRPKRGWVKFKSRRSVDGIK